MNAHASTLLDAAIVAIEYEMHVLRPSDCPIDSAQLRRDLADPNGYVDALESFRRGGIDVTLPLALTAMVHARTLQAAA